MSNSGQNIATRFRGVTIEKRWARVPTINHSGAKKNFVFSSNSFGKSHVFRRVLRLFYYLDSLRALFSSKDYSYYNRKRFLESTIGYRI